MKRHQLLALFFTVFLIAGCSSLIPVEPNPKSIRGVLEPGDKVYALIKGSNEYEWYTVNKYTEHSITLDYQEYDLEDIQKIGKYDESDPTFALLAIGSVIFVWPYIGFP